MKGFKTKVWVLVVAFALVVPSVFATKMFIPMDAEGQPNHLKAYGIAFMALKSGVGVDWMLNYKGGSFGMEFNKTVAAACDERGVKYQKLKDGEYKDITKEVSGLKYDGKVVKLEKAPRIAVYTPLNKEPWDDAVTLALTYAEIPFDKIYAEEVLNGALDKYDWLHLHHEDFTGQYGKFWAQFRTADWYQKDQASAERLARKTGFKKVQQMQVAVVKKIREFVKSGGNMFAMCSATDTYDIALAADSIDICETQFDNDPMDAEAQSKLKFNKCLAFRNFKLSTSPYEYEYSDIDNTNFRKIDQAHDVFTLNHFSVSVDPVPTMLVQNHTETVKGFMGQTTAFRNEFLKPSVLVLAENKDLKEARYIHGDLGKGTWTFYGGHDPESYQHAVGAPPTNLGFYNASPGYRLILNNVLFPAVNRKVVQEIEVSKKNIIAENIPEAKEEIQKIKVTPIPQSEEFEVECPPQAAKPVVVITDPSGKEVLRKQLNSNKERVDVSGLQHGIYNITVNGEYIYKIVKD